MYIVIILLDQHLCPNLDFEEQPQSDIRRIHMYAFSIPLYASG